MGTVHVNNDHWDDAHIRSLTRYVAAACAVLIAGAVAILYIAFAGI